jgi:hypothetical protein
MSVVVSHHTHVRTLKVGESVFGRNNLIIIVRGQERHICSLENHKYDVPGSVVATSVKVQATRNGL